MCQYAAFFEFDGVVAELVRTECPVGGGGMWGIFGKPVDSLNIAGTKGATYHHLTQSQAGWAFFLSFASCVKSRYARDRVQ